MGGHFSHIRRVFEFRTLPTSPCANTLIQRTPQGDQLHAHKQGWCGFWRPRCGFNWSEWLPLYPETATNLLTPPSTALPVHQHIEFQSNVNPHVIPSPTTSLYSHIILDDVTFQTYIRLLGEHNLAAQIPLTLAWMRTLGIIPSKKTLSLSLACFREVTTSMQPLVYAYGKEGSGEYGRLVQWVGDWVPELAPSEDAIITTWARAKRKRELAELWDTEIIGMECVVRERMKEKNYASVVSNALGIVL